MILQQHTHIWLSVNLGQSWDQNTVHHNLVVIFNKILKRKKCMLELVVAVIHNLIAVAANASESGGAMISRTGLSKLKYRLNLRQRLMCLRNLWDNWERSIYLCRNIFLWFVIGIQPLLELQIKLIVNFYRNGRLFISFEQCRCLISHWWFTWCYRTYFS